VILIRIRLVQPWTLWSRLRTLWLCCCWRSSRTL